jgi:hypothetical protein
MSLKRALEAFVSSTPFELGMGYVILSRFKSEGRVESGVFLLDTFCLGAKDAMYVQLDIAEYKNNLLKRFTAQNRLEPIEPSCARKLVEDAVRYAAGLGFQPHPDYWKGSRGRSARFPGLTLTYGDSAFRSSIGSGWDNRGWSRRGYPQSE